MQKHFIDMKYSVFICVCKHGNMTKAAEELFIAQPAVSNTIAEIEKNFNATQFEQGKSELSEDAKFVLHDLAKLMENESAE